jgi:hypothetical protein
MEFVNTLGKWLQSQSHVPTEVIAAELCLYAAIYLADVEDDREFKKRLGRAVRYLKETAVARREDEKFFTRLGVRGAHSNME